MKKSLSMAIMLSMSVSLFASVDVVSASTPQSIFTTQTPANYASDGRYELGVRFSTEVGGTITKVRIYTNASEGGDHTVRLWRNGLQTIPAATWNITPGPAGWKEFTLPNPALVRAGDLYTLSVSNSSDNWYAYSYNGFSSGITNGDLVTYAGSGVFSTTLGAEPLTSFNNSNYFRDVVFVPSLSFTDNFEDGDTAGWYLARGFWNTAQDGTNKVFRTLDIDWPVAVTGGQYSWTDSVVEGKVKITASSPSFYSRQGLVARWSASPPVGNFYAFMYDGDAGELQILKVSNGSAPSVLASKSVTLGAGTWYTFKAELAGSSLEFYVNGVLELTATDSTYASGSAGFVSGDGSYFDDFSATQL